MIDIKTFLHLFHKVVNSVHHTASQVHVLVEMYGLRVPLCFGFAMLALCAMLKKCSRTKVSVRRKGGKMLCLMLCESVDFVVDKECGIRIDCLQS